MIMITKKRRVFAISALIVMSPFVLLGLLYSAIKPYFIMGEGIAEVLMEKLLK